MLSLAPGCCCGLQIVPSSHRESSGSDEEKLPSLAKFLKCPPTRSKVSSRHSKVTDLVESEGDSEELDVASRTPSSGL